MSDISCQTFTEAIQRLSHFFDQNSWRSCLISTATFRIDNTWIPLFTKVRFSRESKETVREPVVFSRLELREHFLAPAEAVELLKQTPPGRLSTHPLLFFQHGYWNVLVPDHTWHDWYPESTPTVMMTRKANSMPGEDQSELFSRISQEVSSAVIEGEARIHFATTIDAIDWWLQRRVTVAPNGTFGIPIIEVTLPLPPGHVRTIAEDAGTLLVELEPHPIPVSLEAYLAFHEEETDQYISDRVVVTKDGARFGHFPEGTYSIEVRSMGKLVSYFRSEANHITRMAGSESDQQLLRRLLYRGERESCEFKDLGDRRTGKPNWPMLESEIPKTACAMANTLGGYILIGVQKDGQALGINDFQSDLCSSFNCEKDEVRAFFARRIHKAIYDRSMKPPSCAFRWVTSETGASVLMIHVTENRYGNITELGQGNIYVRRGASDLRATSDEIENRLRGRLR